MTGRWYIPTHTDIFTPLPDCQFDSTVATTETAYSASSAQSVTCTSTGGNSFRGTPLWRYRRARTLHAFFVRFAFAATSAIDEDCCQILMNSLGATIFYSRLPA